MKILVHFNFWYAVRCTVRFDQINVQFTKHSLFSYFSSGFASLHFLYFRTHFVKRILIYNSIKYMCVSNLHTDATHTRYKAKIYHHFRNSQSTSRENMHYFYHLWTLWFQSFNLSTHFVSILSFSLSPSACMRTTFWYEVFNGLFVFT